MLFSTTLVSSITLAAALATAFVVPRQTDSEYTETFSNQTGAVQGTDFITFTLLDTTDECTAFCDTLPGCTFVNSYHDVNGKGGSPQLTCSAYASCYGLDSLTNTGGQPEGNGTFNSIADSDGFCKSTPTPPPPSTTTDSTTTGPTETADPTTDTTTDPTDTTTDPTETSDPTTDPTTDGTGA